MTGLSNSLSRSLGVEVPIFGFSHSLDTTVAISRSGGIGIWGATRAAPAEIEEGLTFLDKNLSGMTYGVDLVIPPGMPDRDNRDEIEAAIPPEHREFVERLRQKYAVPSDDLAGKRSRFVRSEEMARRQVEVVMDSGATVDEVMSELISEALATLGSLG